MAKKKTYGSAREAFRATRAKALATPQDNAPDSNRGYRSLHEANEAAIKAGRERREQSGDDREDGKGSDKEEATTSRKLPSLPSRRGRENSRDPYRRRGSNPLGAGDDDEEPFGAPNAQSPRTTLWLRGRPLARDPYRQRGSNPLGAGDDDDDAGESPAEVAGATLRDRRRLFQPDSNEPFPVNQGLDAMGGERPAQEVAASAEDDDSPELDEEENKGVATGRRLVEYDGQGERIYEPTYATATAGGEAATAQEAPITVGKTEAAEMVTVDEAPPSRAARGGTPVGTKDTTPNDAADAPEQTGGDQRSRLDPRPDGEYHDGDKYTIISTDSNGNRHVTQYRVEPDGKVRFGDNYLEERAVERPDGGTTIRSYVHPGLKAAIAELEAKAGTQEGLTAQEQRQLVALRGRRNEMSGRVWKEVWDTPETRLITDLALELQLAGRDLTGSSSIDAQQAFNRKKRELLKAIQDLPAKTLRQRYESHYGTLLVNTRTDWMRANYQYQSGFEMAQAQADLDLAVERFYAAGLALPPGTNTTPEYQEAREQLVAALNAIPGEEAREAARGRILPILEQQGSDFVREKVETGAFERGVPAYIADNFRVTPTDDLPVHSLLSPGAAFHWEVQGRIGTAVADILADDLNPGNFYERETGYDMANTEHNAAVAAYEQERAELKASDNPTPEQVADLQDTLASLLVSEAALKARRERLDTFHAGHADAIAVAERDSADRSGFTPQYEFIDPSNPLPDVENAGDWKRINFDLNRAQRVLDGKVADLEQRIADYQAGEVKDWALGDALREEAAALNAEAHFINQVSDQLYQAVTGQERTGDPAADDLAFQQAWPRFAASQVNPYTAQGEAIRRHNLYSDDPIGTSGLLGRDQSSDDDRVIYSPEFAAAFGEITGQRVSGNPEQDTKTLEQAWAALDDRLENEFVGTGKVYKQRVLYDAAGNFAGVDPEFADQSYMLPDGKTTRNKNRALLAWDDHIAREIGFTDPDATLTDDRVFEYPEGHPLQGLVVNSPEANALLATEVDGQFEALEADLSRIDRGLDSFISNHGEDGIDPHYNSAEAALVTEEMRIRGLQALVQSGKYRDLELQDAKTGLTMSGEAWLTQQIAQLQAARGVRSFQGQKSVERLEQGNRQLLREGAASELFHLDRSSANLNPVHVSNRLAADLAVKEAREKLAAAEAKALELPDGVLGAAANMGLMSSPEAKTVSFDRILKDNPEVQQAAKEYEEAWKFRDGVYLSTGWRDKDGLNIHEAQQASQGRGIFETFGVPSELAQHLDKQLVGTSLGDLVGAGFFADVIKAEDPLSPGGKGITPGETKDLQTSLLLNTPAMALAPLTVVGVGGQLIRVGVRGAVTTAQAARQGTAAVLRAGQLWPAGLPALSPAISLAPLRTTLVSGFRQGGASGLKSLTDPRYGERALTYFARDKVGLPLYRSPTVRAAGRSFAEEGVEEIAEGAWALVAAQQTPEFKTALQQGGVFGALQFLDEIYGRRRPRVRSGGSAAPGPTSGRRRERPQSTAPHAPQNLWRYGLPGRPLPNTGAAAPALAQTPEERAAAVKAEAERKALADRYNLWTPPPIPGRVGRTIRQLKGDLGASIAAGMIAMTPYTPAIPDYTPTPVHYQINLPQSSPAWIVPANDPPLPTNPAVSTSASPSLSPSPAEGQRTALSPSPSLPGPAGPRGLSISPSASAGETGNITPTLFASPAAKAVDRSVGPESSARVEGITPKAASISPSPVPSASAKTTLPALSLSTPSPASSLAAASISPSDMPTAPIRSLTLSAAAVPEQISTPSPGPEPVTPTTPETTPETTNTPSPSPSPSKTPSPSKGGVKPRVIQLPARRDLYPDRLSWISHSRNTYDPQTNVHTAAPVSPLNLETLKVDGYTDDRPRDEVVLAGNLALSHRGGRVAARSVPHRAVRVGGGGGFPKLPSPPKKGKKGRRRRARPRPLRPERPVMPDEPVLLLGRR